MKFTLEIELGNDSMSTSDDVGDVLRNKIIRRVESSTFDSPEGPYIIRDTNGNIVGKWEVR